MFHRSSRDSAGSVISRTWVDATSLLVYCANEGPSEQQQFARWPETDISHGGNVITASRDEEIYARLHHFRRARCATLSKKKGRKRTNKEKVKEGENRGREEMTREANLARWALRMPARDKDVIFNANRTDDDPGRKVESN